MKGSREGKRSAAFTILELLVATAVMAVFLLLANEVVTSSLRQWSFANEKMSANLQARLAFDWLSRDLQTLRLREDNSEWLRISPQTVEGSNGLQVTGARLMLFSEPAQPQSDPMDTSSDPARISGPSAVAYSIGWLDPMLKDGPRKQFALLRTAVNARDTFENMGVGNLDTDFWAEGVLGFTTVRPEDVLADHVVGFRVVAEFEDPSTAPATLRRSNPLMVFRYGPDGVVATGTDNYREAKIVALEVTLWILDHKLASRMDSGGNPSILSQAVAFTRRIPILTQ